jgi:penicillin-binding protein 1A
MMIAESLVKHLRAMMYVTAYMLFCFLAALCGGILYLHRYQCMQLEHDEPAFHSKVLDAQNNLVCEFSAIKKKWVPLKRIPAHTIQAFLTIEDRSFYTHKGISIKGIIRSVYVNLIRGYKAQGASTITQQLARMLFLSNKKTLGRKIKEQCLSFALEIQFSKDQLLEAYLNNAYFGAGIYGIAAAVESFWNKEVEELTIAESAALAGIVRHPNKYCPLIFPENTLKRRNLVLRLMHICKHISQKELSIILSQPLSLNATEQSNSYIKEYIRKAVEKEIGKQKLYKQSFTIKTTLSKGMQQQAELHFKELISGLRAKHHNNVNGALITLDIETGGIRALVGGYDFAQSQFNRATQAKRQIGSTLKPLIFAAALDGGLSLCDTAIDEPFEFAQGSTLWQPKNFDKKHRGAMTRAWGLITSNNIVSIKTLLDTGYEKLFEYIKKSHLPLPDQKVPSLALGCLDATPLEITGMFNIFANRGEYVAPHIISWIKDENGEKIFNHQVTNEPVLSWSIASQILCVLQTAFERTHQYYAPLDEFRAFGKSGTTNDARSLFYTGSSEHFTTCIYLGNDDSSALGKTILASTTIFPSWVSYMKNIEPHSKTFAVDPHLKKIKIDKLTGERTSKTENSITLLIE